MYAVVRAGGARACLRDVVDVELMSGEPGEQIELGEVLMVGGDTVMVGKPTVAGAKVLAKIEGDSAGPKIRIFKYKRRKRYRLTKGHRQHFTRVRIESIEV
jgi:large subunit ribosomal protein L21